jgi:hypothetical protein
MAMSSYLNPRWFRLRKRQVNFPGRGKYMFLREHLEVHVKYKGAFPRENIPGLVLGFPRMQHTSNPHSFEVWPREGGLER